MAISTNQFKNGNHIEVDGTVFKILEFQHVKPGKGGAFVRTKLRRAADGAVIDKTFRAGEKFRSVRTEARKMQFLYADGTDAHFMDSQSYDQMTIPESSLADPLRWLKPSDEVDVLFIDESPSDIQLAERRQPPGQRHRPRGQGRHRLGRRDQAGDARDRRGHPGTALRRARRGGARRHAQRRSTCRAGVAFGGCAVPTSAARRSSLSTSTTSRASPSTPRCAATRGRSPGPSPREWPSTARSSTP